MNYGMNTVMNHQAFGKYAKRSLKAIKKEAIRLEKLLSRFIFKSEISKINRSAGIKCEKVSNDTYEVLLQAIEFSKYCQGLFDITIGPLVTLWNNSKNNCMPPEDSKIKQILPLVNYNDIIFNPNKKTIGLKRIGQSIDLGGIGKGFAGDKFIEIFKKYGVSSAFTNLGGNVVVLGTKPDGSPWQVGIWHPREENNILGVVSVINKAIVTSGDYQRYFIDNNGKRYHHILDPSTGYPVNSGLISVTVIADSSMAADALSTILFAAGMKKGIEILRKFSGAEAIFVDTDLQVYATVGLKEYFQASDEISVTILNEKKGEDYNEKEGDI